MEITKETVVLIWLGLLLGPIVIYGIWLQLKFTKTEEGNKFLVDRSMAKGRVRRHTFHLPDDQSKTMQRGAMLNVGMDAANGAYGNDVVDLIKNSIPVLKIYGVYALILGIVGFMII